MVCDVSLAMRAFGQFPHVPSLKFAFHVGLMNKREWPFGGENRIGIQAWERGRLLTSWLQKTLGSIFSALHMAPWVIGVWTARDPSFEFDLPLLNSDIRLYLFCRARRQLDIYRAPETLLGVRRWQRIGGHYSRLRCLEVRQEGRRSQELWFGDDQSLKTTGRAEIFRAPWTRRR